MTIARKHGKDTPLGNWIRLNPKLESRKYLLSVTDLDFLVHHNSLWMLLEGKRQGAKMKPSQIRAFKYLDTACSKDPNYRGFHIVEYVHEELTWSENPLYNPKQRIWLDDKEITQLDLEEFIRFEKPLDWYL